MIRRRSIINSEEPYVLTRGLNDWGDYAIDQVYNAGIAKSKEGLTAKECSLYTGDLIKTGNEKQFMDLSWVQYFSNIRTLKLNNSTDDYNINRIPYYLIYIYPNSNITYGSYFYYGTMGDHRITADIIIPKRTPVSNMFSTYEKGDNKRIYVPNDSVDRYKQYFSSIADNIYSFSDAPLDVISKLKVSIGD